MNNSRSDHPVIVAEYNCPIKDVKIIKQKIQVLLSGMGYSVTEGEVSTESEFILKCLLGASSVAITPFRPGEIPRLERAIAFAPLSAQERMEEIFEIRLKKTREGHIIEVEYFPIPWHTYRRGVPVFDIKLLVDLGCGLLNAIFVKALGCEEIDPYAVSKPHKENP